MTTGVFPGKKPAQKGGFRKAGQCDPRRQGAQPAKITSVYQKNDFRFSENRATPRAFRFGKRGVRPIVTEREAECDGRVGP